MSALVKRQETILGRDSWKEEFTFAGANAANDFSTSPPEADSQLSSGIGESSDAALKSCCAFEDIEILLMFSLT